jgi:hypothetical protein
VGRRGGENEEDRDGSVRERVDQPANPRSAETWASAMSLRLLCWYGLSTALRMFCLLLVWRFPASFGRESASMRVR